MMINSFIKQSTDKQEGHNVQTCWLFGECKRCCVCVCEMIWHSLDEQQTCLWGNASNTHTCTCSSKTHTWMHAHPYALYAHTPHYTTAHSSWGFGVQRMFYFRNSFGLVTLLWWQTEKQVANIKHFTSTMTHTNTHTHTSSHSHFPCISSVSLCLSVNSKKHLAKGRMCCLKLTSWLLRHQQQMYDHSSSDSFVKNTKELCLGFIST